MSIELEPPSQLAFHRPFTQLVKEVLVVRNPNPEPVAFKVKTTAPKQYCVRPNSGRIEANQSVDVQVILQPMKEDPPPDFKCKDKFLVQSVAITAERETLSLPELWSITEKQAKDAKDSIKETKIRCVYLPPVESNLPSPPPTSPLPSKSSNPTSPTSPTSPTPKKGTSNGATSEDGEKRNQSPPPSYKPHDEHKAEKANGTTDRSVPSTATNGHPNRFSNMAGTFPKDSKNNENDPAKLRRQLLEAEEEIKRLNHTIENYKQELSAAQMRQRKSEEASVSANRNSTIGGFSVKTQEKIPEGYYPFEVVVAAAVGAFLFGVMFF